MYFSLPSFQCDAHTSSPRCLCIASTSPKPPSPLVLAQQSSARGRWAPAFACARSRATRGGEMGAEVDAAVTGKGSKGCFPGRGARAAARHGGRGAHVRGAARRFPDGVGSPAVLVCRAPTSPHPRVSWTAGENRWHRLNLSNWEGKSYSFKFWKKEGKGYQFSPPLAPLCRPKRDKKMLRSQKLDRSMVLS